MILIRPILSEKSVKSAEHPKHPCYAFQVHADASKVDVADEVEHIYGVKVADVRTMVVRGKRSNRYTKRGMTHGKAANTKKAIVVLEEGQTIDIYQTL